VEKITHKSVLLLSLKKLPKISNRPMGENWPNLVTLTPTTATADDEQQYLLTLCIFLDKMQTQNSKPKTSAFTVAADFFMIF
jgi:hypothetical protein